MSIGWSHETQHQEYTALLNCNSNDCVSVCDVNKQTALFIWLLILSNRRWHKEIHKQYDCFFYKCILIANGVVELNCETRWASSSRLLKYWRLVTHIYVRQRGHHRFRLRFNFLFGTTQLTANANVKILRSTCTRLFFQHVYAEFLNTLTHLNSMSQIR